MTKAMTKEQDGKTVEIIYYAALREARGLAREELNTKADSLLDLYEELKSKYDLKLPSQLLKAAVNNEYKDLDSKFNARDIIVFIPPVAGG
jgi:molybdopterin converting factor small subunit